MNKEEKNETSPLQKREEFDIFKRFDELDDAVILAELEQRVSEVWVYHFKVKGKDIFGIGKPGVDECAARMAKKGVMLRDESLDWRQDPVKPEYICFTAKVSRILVSKDNQEVVADAAIGTKRQCVFFKDTGTEQRLPNPFWYEQGSMKALRNARLRLIPEEIKTQVIEFAKSKKKRIEKFNDSKTQEKKPSEKPKEEPTEFPNVAQTNFGFPGDEEAKETKDDTKPTQKQMMNIVKLMATLVDMYHFSPEQLITEMDQRFGESDVNKFSPELADQAIDFFEKTIEWNAKKLKTK